MLAWIVLFGLAVALVVIGVLVYLRFSNGRNEEITIIWNVFKVNFSAAGISVLVIGVLLAGFTALHLAGAIPHVVDLTDTAALTAVVSELKVDVLVNCAGVSRPGNLLDSSEQDIDELIDVNLRGLLQLTRLVLPGMVERDLGHVINISSIAGVYNFYGHTVYHATKAAVHQISRQLRNDTVGKRIRVTEICPGRVETEILCR